MKLHLIIAAIIHIAINSHILYITSPLELSSKFAGSSITLHSSAFGYSPKGVNINGVLAISDPLDACTDVAEA